MTTTNPPVAPNEKEKDVLGELCACENALNAYHKLYDKFKEPLNSRSSECRDQLMQYLTANKIKCAQFDHKTVDEKGNPTVETLYLRLLNKNTVRTINEKAIAAVIDSLTINDFIEEIKENGQNSEKSQMSAVLYSILKHKLEAQIRATTNSITLSSVPERKGKIEVLPQQLVATCSEWKNIKTELSEARTKSKTEKDQIIQQKVKLLEHCQPYIKRLTEAAALPAVAPVVPMAPVAVSPAPPPPADAPVPQQQQPKRLQPTETLSFNYVHPTSKENQAFLLFNKPTVVKREPIKIKHIPELLQPIDSWIKTQFSPTNAVSTGELLKKAMENHSEFKQNLLKLLCDNLVKLKESKVTIVEKPGIRKKPERKATKKA
jgi:hypothetical protein